MLFDDKRYLGLIDGCERLLAKALGLLLLLVMVVAAAQLVIQVLWAIAQGQNLWLNERLTRILGDLLTFLIALEVLQNITSYLRRHVVQMELVLITAITAVARKVIVLPHGSETKPQLLAGLGLAALALAAAYWLVRQINQRRPLARTGRARSFRELDP